MCTFVLLGVKKNYCLGVYWVWSDVSHACAIYFLNLQLADLHLNQTLCKQKEKMSLFYALFIYFFVQQMFVIKLLYTSKYLLDYNV